MCLHVDFERYKNYHTLIDNTEAAEKFYHPYSVIVPFSNDRQLCGGSMS